MPKDVVDAVNHVWNWYEATLATKGANHEEHGPSWSDDARWGSHTVDTNLALKIVH